MRYNNVGKTPSVPTCGTLERLHICKEDIKLWKKKIIRFMTVYIT